jgi:acetylornithine aminotransferase/acetylornithine/N-succinyldiaminopimelate aminotransferase
VKKGFEPAVAGFRHVPFNDLDAIRRAITAETVAVLIEAVQGESGIVPAKPEYLLGLRKLCDDNNLLLLLDEVQCGHFRSGGFHAWQTILGPSADFLPDGISMAKSLGGGFPIGAFWLREKYATLLSAGTHATTFGGSALGCAVAVKILDVVERDRLADNARELGGFLLRELRNIASKYPQLVRDLRGLGLMIGIEFRDTPAIDVVNRLHENGVLTIPAGNSVVRLLPALNLKRNEAEEGLGVIEKVVASFA